MHKPSREKGFYGGSVAGPVFKAIMDYVYINTPKNYVPEHQKLTKQSFAHRDVEIKNNIIPNLKGAVAYEVIPMLENAGLKVNYTGEGKVISQSIPAGTAIRKGSSIKLELSNS